MFKKLMIHAPDQSQPRLREVLIEKEPDSDELRTVSVLRERAATPNEVLMFHSGFGRMLDFDKPNTGGPTVGTRQDRKSGNYFPTVDGIDLPVTSADEGRARQIAQDHVDQAVEARLTGDHRSLTKD